jgi:hypothetical protein
VVLGRTSRIPSSEVVRSETAHRGLLPPTLCALSHDNETLPINR